jgi:large subunit ribosomal protein L9
MLVILEQNLAGVGQVGDLITVKPGYARNFLIPRGLAVLADEKKKKFFEHQKRMAQHKKQKELTTAQELANVISTLSLTITKPVGEGDKIFGSVTTHELAEAFKNAGHTLDRRLIKMNEEIKRVGVYKGTVKLHPEVSAEFNIWVVAQA